jgi:hypothetical protein
VSLNNHAGFETGAPLKDGYVLGTAVALRGWLSKNTWALTLRGEALVNPSGYVTAFPPPGYSAAASGPLRIWGVTASAEYFVTDFFSLRGEVLYRKSTSPYFAGPGGTTSGDGYADTSAAGFVPDLVRAQTLGIVAANFRL